MIVLSVICLSRGYGYETACYICAFAWRYDHLDEKSRAAILDPTVPNPNGSGSGGKCGGTCGLAIGAGAELEGLACPPLIDGLCGDGRGCGDVLELGLG